MGFTVIFPKTASREFFYPLAGLLKLMHFPYDRTYFSGFARESDSEYPALPAAGLFREETGPERFALRARNQLYSITLILY